MVPTLVRPTSPFTNLAGAIALLAGLLAGAPAIAQEPAGPGARQPEAIEAAEQAALEGRVIQEGTSLPVADAVVEIEGTGIRTSTDAEGRFALTDLPAGTWTVRVSAAEREPVTRKVTVTEVRRQTLEVALPAAPVEMAAVTVLVDRFRLAEPLEDVPGSVHVLERGDLESQNLLFEDVHGLLRQVPGVIVQEEEGFGRRANIGLRGTGSERSSKITVMEDGVLAAPAPYAAPSAYYFPVAGRMDAIEVRKGSSQIKYGPHTTGGALNLISTPIPRGFAARGTAEGGEFGTVKAHAWAGGSSENAGWLLETYRLGSDGFKELDGGGDTGFELTDVVGKLRVNTDHDARVYQELELKLGRTDEASDETYLGLTDADFRADPYRRYPASQLDFLDAEHTLAQLRHVVRPASAVDVTTVLYRTDFSRSWYKLNDVNGESIGDVLADPAAFADELAILRGDPSEPGALGVRDNAREYYAQGVQSVVGLGLGSGAVRHELEIGARWHRDEEDRFQRDDAYGMVDARMVLTSRGAPGGQSNRVSEAEAWAFFLQDRITAGRWTFTPGVRVEDVAFTRSDWAADDPGRDGPATVRENGVTALIPGVGVTWDAGPDLTLLAGVHRGFGPPGPGADAETEAEESVNYELGARIRRGALQAQAVGFLNDYENVLGTATLSSGGDGSGDLFNGGEVDVRGVELSLDWDAQPAFARALGASLPVRVAYTFTRTEFGSSFESDFEPWGTVKAGDELPYVPDHQLYAGLGLEAGNWAVRLASTWVGEMRTEAGSGPILEGTGTDDFLIFGLTGELAVTPWSRVFASVQNLTDEAYVVARRPDGARPGLPRTLAAGIRLTP